MAKSYKSIERQGWLNNATWSSWFNRLYAIAMSVFKWEGLPATVDERFMEMVLFWRGNGLYFSDEIMGQLFLPMATASDLDVYGYPKLRQAVSYNYTSDFKDASNSVVVYDNYSRYPVAATVKMYATRLYNLDMTIDVNVRAQKTPVLILCDNKSRLTLQNVYQQYDGNMPVIYGSKALFDSSAFQVLKTDAPYHGSEFQALKRQLLEECLCYLGVEANTNEKSERLVSNEIVSNMGSTEALRLNRLKARRQAAEEINRIFGTNISVDFDSKLTLAMLMNGEGGLLNGSLYNASQNNVRDPDGEE